MVASFGKVLIILIIIGNYHEMDYPFLINAFVFATHAETLKVALDSSYSTSCCMIFYGILLKMMVQVAIYYMNPSMPFWII
jgi:hypothetical protein